MRIGRCGYYSVTSDRLSRHATERKNCILDPEFRIATDRANFPKGQLHLSWEGHIHPPVIGGRGQPPRAGAAASSQACCRREPRRRGQLPPTRQDAAATVAEVRWRGLRPPAGVKPSCTGRRPPRRPAAGRPAEPHSRPRQPRRRGRRRRNGTSTRRRRRPSSRRSGPT